MPIASNSLPTDSTPFNPLTLQSSFQTNSDSIVKCVLEGFENGRGHGECNWLGFDGYDAALTSAKVEA